MIGRLAGLTIQFLGFVLMFSALSLAASGRALTAWLAVLAGLVTFLLGRRLLRTAASAGR